MLYFVQAVALLAVVPIYLSGQHELSFATLLTAVLFAFINQLRKPKKHR